MSDKTLLAANIRQIARIEELEKELAGLRRHKNLYAANARIAELEAEVARLTALQLPADLSLGEALAYRSEDHGKGKKP